MVNKLAFNKNISKILINMLLNPNSKKVYKELSKLYEEFGKLEEVEALEFLIKEKFNENYSSSLNKI